MARNDSPQDIVEAALAAATTDGTVVIVTDRSEANLRWANSALTTNGEMRSLTLTVTATAEVPGGTATGTLSQEIAGPDEVTGVVAAAEHLARTGTPAEDAIALVEDYPHGDDWELAMSPDSLTGLLSWLEAAPPGVRRGD